MPRYASFEHLIDPEGKVWRYPDDLVGIWALCWNDTMPAPVTKEQSHDPHYR